MKSLAAVAALLLAAACAKTEPDAGNGGLAGDAGAGAGTVQPGGGAVVESLDALQQQMQAQVGDRVFFGTDRYDLSSEAQNTLQGQAAFLQQNPSLRMIIEGHADERGTREYNLALGERRAEAVRNYLAALGVAPSRLETVSYGKERPAMLGQGEAVWQMNRRAVSVLQQ